MPVKFFVPFFLLAVVVHAQTPDNSRIVTFNRADTEHCKVAVVNGKPLLETTYNGTTVAITMPQNWGNGEFSVFVAVAQTGEGEAQVNPQGISAVYPDPAHTRFRWFDKGHDLDTQASAAAEGLGRPGDGGGPPASGGVGDSSTNNLAPNHPEAMRQADPHVGTRSEEEARQLELRNQAANASKLPKLDPAHPPVFLKITTVKQGSRTAGYVFLKKPKGSKVQVTPEGMLDEIDIPVNGVIFRF
jgi:hypothetical protein